MARELNKETIIEWLDEVKDPEIPVISLVDLGVITNVSIKSNKEVKIDMTPTFVGCPAMDYMKQDVVDVLTRHGIEDVEVEISFKEQWNSNKITDKGRKALHDFGLAPPPKHNLQVDIDILEHIECPNCGSDNTILKTPFGPSACRSIHHCEHCQETFEQFKPV